MNKCSLSTKKDIKMLSYLKDIFMYLKPEDIVLQDTAAKDEDPAYSIHLFITTRRGLMRIQRRQTFSK